MRSLSTKCYLLGDYWRRRLVDRLLDGLLGKRCHDGVAGCVWMDTIGGDGGVEASLIISHRGVVVEVNESVRLCVDALH